MSDLTLVYFAWVREAIGRDEEQVERPAADVTIAALITIHALIGRLPCVVGPHSRRTAASWARRVGQAVGFRSRPVASF